MKFKCLLLVMLSATALKAQQLTLKGLVVDAKSGTPIAAATISVSAKSFFYPADDDGRFNIVSDKLKAADTVSFSCIGYQTKKITVDHILIDTIIKLTPSVNALKEVSIGYKPPTLVNVGSKKRSSFAISSYLPGMEKAVFMVGSEKVKGIIKTVGFYLSSGNFLSQGKGDVTAPFRIRLYAVNSDGSPGKELKEDVIVASAKKNHAWFDVDISGYEIENPVGGFFASFCLLNQSFYASNNYRKGLNNSSVAIRSPRLGFTTAEFNGGLSYTGTESNSIVGHYWHRDDFKENFMIRAAIAAN